jgi:polar amino acid transport system substrate-binding protein
MIKTCALFMFFLIPLLTGAHSANSAEAVASPEAKIYVFHTALQSPIKETLESRIQEAFRRLGLKAEIRVNPSAQRALLLANEEGDGDAGRVTHIKTIDPTETNNLIQVPEPLINLVLTVYTKDKSFPVTGWQSLQGYHVGARLGAKIMEKNIPGQKTLLPTTVQLVQMLDSGRIEAMVEWDLIADYAIEKRGLKFNKLEPPLLTQPFHLYLHKKHQHLVGKINKVLQEMKAEGAFNDTTTDFVFYSGLQPPLKYIVEKRLQEAFKRVGGFTLKLINPGSAQRALILANEDGDGDANRVINLKQLSPANTGNLILIPEPLNIAHLQVYTTGAVSKIEGYDSLRSFRNGFRVGVKILEKNVPGQRIMLPETTRLLRMLNDSRIDTVIEWPTIADTIIKKNNYTNIKKLPTPLINLSLYPYIHQKHYTLVPKLARALKQMKQDGTFAKIETDAKQQNQPLMEH